MESVQFQSETVCTAEMVGKMSMDLPLILSDEMMRFPNDVLFANTSETLN